MASYASDRSSLFGVGGGRSSKKQAAAAAPKPAPRGVALRSFGSARAASAAAATTTTESTASSSSSREQEAGSARATCDKQDRIDAASSTYDEAEALVCRPDDAFRRMMWKRDAHGAGAKFARAAHQYAAVGYAGPARDAFEKAAACHSETDDKALAAAELENAARHACSLGSPGFDISGLLTSAAGLWYAQGETGRAAETLVRGATKLMVDVDDLRCRSCMLELAMDYAEATTSKTSVMSAPDVHGAAVRFFCLHPLLLLDKASDTIPRYLRALDAAGHADESPLRLRALAAVTIIHLAQGDLEAASSSFMESLGTRPFASSSQAEASEDLLAAYKSKDAEALTAAQASPALGSLDAEVVALAKNLRVKSRAPEIAEAEWRYGDVRGDLAEEDLPDVT